MTTANSAPSPRPRWAVALLALGAWTLSAAAQQGLPDFGDPASRTLSASEERALGEAFMREIRAALPVMDDPVVTGYVQDLGYRIASQTEAGSGFTFFVVEEDSINAFAGPGGYIGLNTGLILTTETESELASVVAHETAHVVQRHIARMIDMSSRMRLPALAAMLAAIVVGTQAPQAGQAATAGVMGLQTQMQLDFIRSNELEADRVGMQLLAKADFDPRAMPAFFERLQTASRFYRRPPEYLSTHPVTTGRIADSRNRAEQFAYRQHPDSLSYHLVRARLRVLTSNDMPATATFFEDALERGNYRSLPATAYGWGLSLTAMDRTDRAREALDRLVQTHPDQTEFRAALAQNEFRAGDVPEAISIYDDALRLYPDSRVLLEGYVRTLLAAGRPGRALELIEDYSRLHGMDGTLYGLSADAHMQAGDRVEGQLAAAEYFYVNGRLERAIRQLREAAQEPDPDYYRSARVQARLKEMERERELRTSR